MLACLAIALSIAVPVLVPPSGHTKRSERAKPDTVKKSDVIVPAWADVIDAKPQRGVVKDTGLRKEIEASGYAWRVRDRVTGIEMLLVPAGSYARGASEDDKDPHPEEMPRHTVTISRPFYLGCYEVQEHEWNHVMNGEPLAKRLGRAQGGRTYDDADAFLRKANAENEFDSDLRLPSEAEWEYACRAGTTGITYGKSIASIGWYKGNASGNVQVVGQREPNPFGFYDMIGNVKEWCLDYMDPRAYERLAEHPEKAVDPIGDADRSRGHTLRGGGVNSREGDCRASLRERAMNEPRTRPYGLRVARNP